MSDDDDIISLDEAKRRRGNAPPAEPTNNSVDDQIKFLAGLGPIEYDRVREKKADELGIRRSTLDDAVARSNNDRNPILSGAICRHSMSS